MLPILVNVIQLVVQHVLDRHILVHDEIVGLGTWLHSSLDVDQVFSKEGHHLRARGLDGILVLKLHHLLKCFFIDSNAHV